MILDEGEDDQGKFFRASLISRYALTIENYAASDWGNRFYSPEFLEGFCEQRNKIHERLAAVSKPLFIQSILLAFLQNVQGTITIWGISFSVPEVGSLALAVSIALNLYICVCAMLDQLIIDRLMNTLGNRIGAASFEIAIIDKTAINIWVHALTPKYFGLKSGGGHEAMFKIHNSLFLIYALMVILFPLSVSGFAIAYQLTSDPGLLEWVLSGCAFFIFIFTIFLVLTFSISFKFRPSGLSEPSDPFVPESFLDMGHPRRNSTTENSTK